MPISCVKNWHRKLNWALFLIICLLLRPTDVFQDSHASIIALIFGHKIEQRVTGVLKSERGRGLGKWLKAKMLQHIRTTYPDAKYINTGYANTNDPMISINERLGFAETQRDVFYTMTVEQAKTYLKLD